MASLADALLGGQQGPIPLASLMPKPNMGNIPLASMMGVQSAWPGAMNQADAVQQTAGQAGDWLARKHQEGIDAGNWNPETHMPTQQALADGLNQYGQAMIAGTSAPGRPGFTAYHGSPHSFDKFDLSKIGTGEGSQAYGHGMYVAENEGVARSYKDAGPAAREQLDAINAQMTQLSRQMDKYSSGQYGKYNDPKGYELKDQYDALMDQRTKLGHMYEVAINADPEKFLHWDKPLSEQHPEVREAVAPLLDRYYRSVADSYQKPQTGWGDLATNESAPSRTEIESQMNGQRLYEALRHQAGGAAAVSTELQAAGIPGIRYLDQGSRGAGDGTHNAVVFSPETMEIIRKYGLAGLMGGGAAAATQTPDQ